MNQPTTAATPGSSAAMVSPRRKLRNFLLDPGLQLRLGGYLVAIAVGLSAALGWQVWRAYSEASELVALGDPRSDGVVAAMLRADDRARMLWTAGILSCVVLCLLGLAVVVTHRIAGPALAMARTCRAVASGALVRPRPLRRGDLLVGLADEVNAMVEGLRAREEEERERLARAAQVLVRSPEEAKEMLEQLVAEKARRVGA
jgi:hypothetical protein